MSQPLDRGDKDAYPKCSEYGFHSGLLSGVLFHAEPDL